MSSRHLISHCTVVNGNLKVGSPGKTKVFVRDGKPLEGYSYMLFRIEKRAAQDWESLTQIKELVYQAQDAVFNREYEKAKAFLLPAIEATIFRSPDLIKVDRRNMVLKIRESQQLFNVHVSHVGKELVSLIS